MSSGFEKMAGDSDGELPIIGTMLMLSAPAAIITSASPTRMRSAAICTADRPEAQKRLTVMPPTLLGRPASTAPMRATFRPCCASGIAQPQIDVFDGLRIEARHLRQRRPQGRRQQVVGPGVAEVAAVRAADGRAAWRRRCRRLGFVSWDDSFQCASLPLPLAGEGWGEGLGASTRICLHHTVRLVQHFVVPEAQRPRKPRLPWIEPRASVVFADCLSCADRRPVRSPSNLRGRRSRRSRPIGCCRRNLRSRICRSLRRDHSRSFGVGLAFAQGPRPHPGPLPLAGEGARVFVRGPTCASLNCAPACPSTASP